MDDTLDVRLVSTGQHKELLRDALANFSLVPDFDLDLMTSNQGLNALTGKILNGLDALIEAMKPNLVLVQGDTTTVLAASLAAFHKGVKIAHVEAGLRTGRLSDPFPEEGNRQLVSRLATIHFAPTLAAVHNLEIEGIPADAIKLTGNTGIDALLRTEKNIDKTKSNSVKRILITCHRRENFGEPLNNICRAISILAGNNPEIEFRFPVHPNPNVKSAVDRYLAGIPNVKLLEPMGYREFVAEMAASHLILTDSGGVQEEAPALGKPVLVLRRDTERPEAVSAGVAMLVGTDETAIIRETERLLTQPNIYENMAIGASPYGDGKSSQRIVQYLKQILL
jgi:UDP-N-acetylglucosamine 2-epimerase (non-hydrolysing)